MSYANKILMIFSSMSLPKDMEIIKQIKALDLDGLVIDLQLDPSRNELERLLSKNQYSCIIPCTPISVPEAHGDREPFKYNILHFLDTLGVYYLGNGYITNLVLQDKVACLKLSEINLPAHIMTRFRYESAPDNCMSMIDTYPLSIETQPSNNHSATKRYSAYTKTDAENILFDIFSHDDSVNEVLIQQRISGEDLSVTIIGNPPYAVDMHSPIKAKLGNGLTQQIVSKAYELFDKFSIKDFGYFKFLIPEGEEKYYLIDVSGISSSSDIVFFNVQNKCISPEELISSLVITYLERTKKILYHLSVVENLIPFLEQSKVKKLLSLESKMQLYHSYTYEDVCSELRGRILKPDESNKFDFIKLITESLSNAPKPVDQESPFLGTHDRAYTFLDDYNDLPLYPKNQQSVLQSSIEILNGQMRWHSPSVLYNVFPPVMFNTIAASAITNLYNPNAITRHNCAGFLQMEKQIVKQMSTIIGWNPEESAGVFTTGGKFCLTYAIKCGLNRCLDATASEKTPIVITSEINHYSIELSCFQLGLPKSSCIRIPINSSGTIDFDIFEKVLREKLKSNTPIACIIFSGGNTTHCTVESIFQGNKITKKAVEDYGIGYEPYKYYDLVIGWPWLFYKEYDFDNNALKINHEALDKIRYIADSFKHSDLADGIGIDFHKGGFAPFTNSLFLSKESTDLFSVSGKNVEDIYREPNNYTFNNSRGTTDIISAWNILQSVGIQGFQSYVANMVTVTNTFATELSKYGFEILEKDNTYGFATIIWTHMPTETYNFKQFAEKNHTKMMENGKYLFHLSEYLKNNQQSSHYVRFLPNYKPVLIEHNIAVISILPTTLHIDRSKTIAIAEQLGKHKQEFDLKYLDETMQTSEIMPQEVPK